MYKTLSRVNTNGYDLDITSIVILYYVSKHVTQRKLVNKGWKPEEFLKDHKKTYSITQGDKVIGEFTEKNFRFLEEENGVKQMG